jgi:hypothetical protein
MTRILFAFHIASQERPCTSFRMTSSYESP